MPHNMTMTAQGSVVEEQLSEGNTPFDGVLFGRVFFVGSSGGHLAQLLPLMPLFRRENRTWVTFRTGDALGALRQETDVVWAYHPTTRSVRNLLRNTGLAWRLLRERRPDVIITTGAAVALPYFVLSRLFGARTVYIEVYDRVDSPTLTARLCSPFTDVMLVQWDEQRTLYRDTIAVGPLL